MNTKKSLITVFGAVFILTLSSQALAHPSAGVNIGVNGFGFTVADRNVAFSTFIFGPPQPRVVYQPVPVPVPRWRYGYNPYPRYYNSGYYPRWKHRHFYKGDYGYSNSRHPRHYYKKSPRRGWKHRHGHSHNHRHWNRGYRNR